MKDKGESSSRPRRLAPILAAATVFATARPAAAAPITFDTALPVDTGEVIVRQQAMWLRASGDPGAVRADGFAVPSVLVYGLNPRVTLMAILPFMDKELRADSPMGRIHRSASGFGDLLLVDRLTAVQVDTAGQTIRLAPFAGLKLPTGASQQADDAGVLPRPLQVGSGSWDALAGAVFTWQRVRWQSDVAASYFVRNRANGSKAGNEARADASLQYRVLPWSDIGEGVPGFVYAVVETHVSDVAPDSGPAGLPGGWSWFVAPGAQYVTERYVVEASVELPVAQPDVPPRVDFIARAGFRANF